MDVFPDPLSFSSADEFVRNVDQFLSTCKSADAKTKALSSILSGYFDVANRAGVGTVPIDTERLEDEVHQLEEEVARLQRELDNARTANPTLIELQSKDRRIRELNEICNQYKILSQLKAERESAVPTVSSSSTLDIPDPAIYKLIPKFTGKASKGYSDFSAWLLQFKLHTQHLSKPHQLKYLIGSTVGEAWDTILSLDTHTRSDFDRLVAVLEERFPPMFTVQQCYNMLRVACQEDNESVNQWANRLRGLKDRSLDELQKFVLGAFHTR